MTQVLYKAFSLTNCARGSGAGQAHQDPVQGFGQAGEGRGQNRQQARGHSIADPILTLREVFF